MYGHDAVETIEGQYGHVARIFPEYDAGESPREWCNLGRIYMDSDADRGYLQPDGRDADDGIGWDEKYTLPEALRDRIDNAYGYAHDRVAALIEGHRRLRSEVIPLSRCERSGGLIPCGSDHADGYIYVTRDQIKREYGHKVATATDRKQAREVMSGEIETYWQYATGDVYYVTIEGPDGETAESCSGLYGIDYATESAREMLADVERDHAASVARARALIASFGVNTARVADAYRAHLRGVARAYADAVSVGN